MIWIFLLMFHLIFYATSLIFHFSSKQRFNLRCVLGFFIPFLGPVWIIIRSYIYHFQNYEQNQEPES